MEKESIDQEAVEENKCFLQVPGAEFERESSRGHSALSSRTSVTTRSRLHFKTAVQMLAPVIWSRIHSNREV